MGIKAQQKDEPARGSSPSEQAQSAQARRAADSRPGSGSRGQAARRWRRLIWAGTVVVLVAVLGSLVFATHQASTQGAPVGLQVGDRAPNFTLRDLQGKQVSLHSFLGRPVLLHFWAVDCTSCQAEQPDYLRAIKALGAKAPVILAEDAWGEPADYVAPYVRKEHIPGTVLIDTSRAIYY